MITTVNLPLEVEIYYIHILTNLCVCVYVCEHVHYQRHSFYYPHLPVGME